MLGPDFLMLQSVIELLAALLLLFQTSIERLENANIDTARSVRLLLLGGPAIQRWRS